MKKRFFNMYLTTTISVSMVLFLIGLECTILLGAHDLIHRVRENLALTVVMTSDADSTDVARMQQMFAAAPYCHHADYISKERALQEHIETLGEDPEKFLGFNPLTESYEVYLNADYAHNDSITRIIERLTSLPYVEDVIYQEEVVRVIDHGIGEVSVVLAIVGIILLLMSFALITNTIRLHIYSKRFIINTMRLVGATPWVIRAPFIRRNVIMGMEAGIIALIALAGAYYYSWQVLGIMLFPLTTVNVVFMAAVVILGGELIACVASLIATGRYVRMKIDKMYEI